MSKPTNVDDLPIEKISLIDNSPPPKPVGGGDVVEPFHGRVTFWIPVRGYLHAEVYPRMVPCGNVIFNFISFF
jgi:hypothetical protein